MTDMFTSDIAEAMSHLDEIEGCTDEQVNAMLQAQSEYLKARETQVTNNQEFLESIKADILTKNERLDSDEKTPEQLAIELKKQANRFRKSIDKVFNVQAGGFEQHYENKKGEPGSFYVDVTDATMYLLKDQPDEPQLTANAIATRSGKVRISDEA